MADPNRPRSSVLRRILMRRISSRIARPGKDRVRVLVRDQVRVLVNGPDTLVGKLLGKLLGKPPGNLRDRVPIAVPVNTTTTTVRTKAADAVADVAVAVVADAAARVGKAARAKALPTRAVREISPGRSIHTMTNHSTKIRGTASRMAISTPLHGVLRRVNMLPTATRIVTKTAM